MRGYTIVAFVWVIAEGAKKVPDGPENTRSQNSQVFSGKYHTPIRAQQLKLGEVLPYPIVQGPVVGKSEKTGEVKLLELTH